MMRRWIRGSKGLQTLEWVALALVVLALLGAVTAYLNGPGGAQVAAPIQQALQRYAWCLEGAGACPGAGGGNAFRTNPPGVNPLGTNPPGVNPPGANPPKGKPLDPGWCATHPRDCFSNLGKWVADRWEGVKQGAAQAWEGLKSTAEGVWKWLDEHKGLVAGGVVAGLLILGSILLTGGVALPIWLAVFGAVAFGGLYQLSGPKPGLQGWLEAFALAGTGAVMGYLLGQGGAMLAGLVKEAGWTAIWKLFVGKGIVGGVSSNYLDDRETVAYFEYNHPQLLCACLVQASSGPGGDHVAGGQAHSPGDPYGRAPFQRDDFHPQGGVGGGQADAGGSDPQRGGDWPLRQPDDLSRAGEVREASVQSLMGHAIGALPDNKWDWRRAARSGLEAVISGAIVGALYALMSRR
jgi:hypothetical protein